MELSVLEKFLHIPCLVAGYDKEENLPLYLRGLYRLQVVEVAGISFLAAAPEDMVSAAALKNHRKQLMEHTGMECAFVLEGRSTYLRDRLLESGVPFICPGKEIYLPFLGIALEHERRKKREAPEKISFLTQKMLLTILYEGVENGSAAEMAARLGVSRMTGTRCFDEVEAMIPQLIQRKGRRRVISWTGTKRKYTELVRPVLRTPVLREYRLATQVGETLPVSGLSALCCCTMLNDDPYPTCMATRDVASKLGLGKLPQMPRAEMPAQCIQVVAYQYPFSAGGQAVMDPVSVSLAIPDALRKEPRVEQAIEEMMEEYVYHEGS